LTAVRFIKDNRLLPKGFNKSAVDAEIAPQGGATTDANFIGGGDKIRYTVNTGNAQGPFQVEAEMWFQPIAYRWANNLKAYDAMEPQRFVRYYEGMASGFGSKVGSGNGYEVVAVSRLPERAIDINNVCLKFTSHSRSLAVPQRFI
jgi:hypothetical protein